MSESGHEWSHFFPPGNWARVAESTGVDIGGSSRRADPPDGDFRACPYCPLLWRGGGTVAESDGASPCFVAPPRCPRSNGAAVGAPTPWRPRWRRSNSTWIAFIGSTYGFRRSIVCCTIGWRSSNARHPKREELPRRQLGVRAKREPASIFEQHENRLCSCSGGPGRRRVGRPCQRRGRGPCHRREQLVM